jgi:hypothetical protein
MHTTEITKRSRSESQRRTRPSEDASPSFRIPIPHSTGPTVYIDDPPVSNIADASVRAKPSSGTKHRGLPSTQVVMKYITSNRIERKVAHKRDYQE